MDGEKTRLRIHAEIKKRRALVHDMALILGKTPQSIYYHLRKGTMPCIRVRYDLSEAYNSVTHENLTPEELFRVNE